MRGPEVPPVLMKASDRLSRSRIWNAVHRHPEAPPAAMGEAEGQEPTVSAEPVRLGERGTPVASPRRQRR